ncbi:helix-turn-helix transcriptional regulator [Cellulomonas sp. zg-ZUI222]|uniref:Helix-turn-helix transcriptional regulator n=1 Tax=Cellulomonas wangleii TaxID=2816956 RepID=A0ABX8D6S5_9CELL|nr:helix-turn-helix transcriptional regulator [Cellulomonas wangleii]MBO0922552.1 helix-turn-helix transcriptional regulator [Cellulomonas wangleii]MBO0926743.1 helix-turn-helix transcriptional regulator [Cellulomonas wangleii]QVI63143.1 helix-turn-helix transcriptional regulator [Cellulomonas wangleii]
MHPVSERIRDARERSGLSQADLARAARMHPSYVSHLERGVRGPGDGALERLARALGVTTTYLEQGERSPAYRASEAAVVRARQLLRAGRAAEAVTELQDVDLDSLDVDQGARVLLARAEALDLFGDLEGASRVLVDTARLLMDGHRPRRAAYATTRLVMTLIEAGDVHGAVRAGEERLAVLAGTAAGTDELFRLETTLVWAYVARGDATYARVRGNELLARALVHGSARAVWSVHWNLAFVDDALGDAQDALGHLGAALALAGGAEADRDVPRLRLDLADLLLAVTPARPHEALAELDAAGTALEVAESAVELARAATTRCRALLLLGRYGAALEQAQRAVDLLGSGQRRDAAPALEALGDALLASGDRSAAVKTYRQVEDRLDLVPAGRSSAVAWRRLGDRLRAAGDDRVRVAEAYRRALDAAGVGTPRP